jgi:hypothetical protein
MQSDNIPKKQRFRPDEFLLHPNHHTLNPSATPQEAGLEEGRECLCVFVYTQTYTHAHTLTHTHTHTHSHTHAHTHSQHQTPPAGGGAGGAAGLLTLLLDLIASAVSPVSPDLERFGETEGDAPPDLARRTSGAPDGAVTCHPKLKYRNLKPETRDLRLETRDPRPET